MKRNQRVLSFSLSTIQRHKNRTSVWHPDCGDSQPPELCCLSWPAYGILLWQPEQIKTGPIGQNQEAHVIALL